MFGSAKKTAAQTPQLCHADYGVLESVSIVTYTILGAPDYNYSIMGSETLF